MVGNDTPGSVRWEALSILASHEHPHLRRGATNAVFGYLDIMGILFYQDETDSLFFLGMVMDD